MRYIVVGAIGMLIGLFIAGPVGFFAGMAVAQKKEPTAPTQPMPTPAPGPNPAPKNGDEVIRGSRFEIVDARGTAIVFYVDPKGSPMALVRDGDIARPIDLAKVARLVK